jgi:hypothetical protein
MLDWRDFVLLEEIKDLPVEEQKRLYLSEQTQHEYFNKSIISEQMLHLIMMQSMAAGSGGPRKDLTSSTTTADQEITTQDGKALLTEAGAYLITQ